MKKRIISMTVTIMIIVAAFPATTVISETDETGLWLRERDITDEQLAEMVTNGEIPQSTVRLNLSGNQISDLTPLIELTDLRSLNLSANQITDLSPLSQLTNLQILHLSSNKISDLTPLSELSNLHSLSLSQNQIRDITPLSGLTNLGTCFGGGVTLASNQITDITPLANLTNLGALDIHNNLITDVTPLANLTNLWILDLRNNQIEDVMPLVWLTGLDSFGLMLHGNPVASDTEQLAELRAARSRNAHRTTLTLGHVLGTEPYTVNDALEILRYTVGLPSVLDNCTVAVIAALIVNEEVPDVRDALQILRSVVGLSSAFDEG
jgi:internalin A